MGRAQVIRRGGPRRCSSRARRRDWRSIQICSRSATSTWPSASSANDWRASRGWHEHPALLSGIAATRAAARATGLRRSQDAAFGGSEARPLMRRRLTTARERAVVRGAERVEHAGERRATGSSSAPAAPAPGRARARARARGATAAGRAGPRSRDGSARASGSGSGVRRRPRGSAVSVTLRAPARGLEAHGPGGPVALPSTTGSGCVRVMRISPNSPRWRRAPRHRRPRPTAPGAT